MEPRLDRERCFGVIGTLRLAVIGAALLTTATACTPTVTEAIAAGELDDLPSVDALRAEFNEDAGVPRLLLLLSPT